MITQSRLKELLNYDPSSGLFTWIKPKGSRAKVGDIAGSNICGYLSMRIDTSRHYIHRLAWLYLYGEFPLDQIDHINGDRSDNRIANLRCVDDSENKKNMKRPKNNTSGVSGVCWHKHASKWWSRISADGIVISLGLFSDKFEAICTRKSAENKYDYHINHGRKG